MTQAVFGFVGAILGASISAITVLLIERQRTTRDGKASTEEESKRIQIAARLVYEELSDSTFTLCHAVDTYHWWPHGEHELPTDRWREFAPTLAAPTVDSSTFVWISTAYQVIRDLNAALRQEASHSGTLPHFDVEQDRRCRMTIGTINDGLFGLAELLDFDFGDGIEPDQVAALQMACANEAAKQLGEPVKWEDGERSEVRVDPGEQLIGIALMRAPKYQAFNVETDAASDFMHFGQCGDYEGIVLHGSENRRSQPWIPESIRNNPNLKDVAFLKALSTRRPE